MNQVNSLFSILAPNSKPVLMRNEKHPEKVLITPFMQADGATPKTDLQGRPVGSIMLSQEKTMMNGSFLNVQKRYAFLSGTIESLQTILDRFKLTAGSEVPGTIQVLESLQPFFDNQKPKVNPTTQEVIGFDINGAFYPVYYQTRYTENLEAKDVTIRSVEDAMNWLNARNIKAAEEKVAVTVVETSAIPVTETVNG